jgi:hypothetical protein
MITHESVHVFTPHLGTHLSNCQRVEKMRAKGYVEPVFRVSIPSINLYPSLGVILKFVRLPVPRPTPHSSPTMMTCLL